MVGHSVHKIYIKEIRVRRLSVIALFMIYIRELYATEQREAKENK